MIARGDEHGGWVHGQSVPVWGALAPDPECVPLTFDARVDVCVVGAGVAGLSTALALIHEGKQVLVLEAGSVCGAETGRTTAHLTSALDDRYFMLEKMHGLEGARLAAQSHARAIDAIEESVRREDIQCDFARLDGYLSAPRADESERSSLDAEAALARELEAVTRAGLDAAIVRRAPIASFDTGPCLRFSGQGRLEPIRYCAGLRAAILRLGGRICTGTKVRKVTGGAGATVETEGGASVEAAFVVVATNTPINDRIAIHTKQSAVRTYAVALEAPPDDAPDLLLWDGPWTHRASYHYVRFAVPGASRRAMLIVGGEDHRTGQADGAPARFRALEDWARARFPGAGRVRAAWSGQVIEPQDGLAFIGRNPGDAPNIFIVTGDSGNGMTHGALAGVLIPDLIGGRPNPWAHLYDPSRVSLRALPEFAGDALNVAVQYADWLKPSDAASPEEIALGEGRVVRDGIHLLACSRDERGALTCCNARCTHLGGVVRWNACERTWDCPCHGSRFTPEGRVLNGPATADLHPAQNAESLQEVPEPEPLTMGVPPDVHAV